MRPKLKPFILTALILAIISIYPSTIMAQTVAVTGTITDTQTTPYSNGLLTVTFVNSTGQQATFGGNPSFQKSYSVFLDANGSFTISLPPNSTASPSIQPAGTQWNFSYQSQGGYGAANINVTITGAGSISGTLSNLARITWPYGNIPPPGAAGQGIVFVSSTRLGWGSTGGAGTVTHTAGNLTLNSMMLGNGVADAKVDTGCLTDGAGALSCVSFTATGPGSAYTQWTTAALPVSGAGTVLCGANTGNLFSCSDNAGPVTAIPFLAGDIGGTQASPQTVGLHLTAEGYTGNQALTFICANDTVTGPTNNLLTLQTSTGCIKATTGNTNVPLTITFSGGATSGSSHQVYSGIGSCIMDATTASTQGFYVIASVLVAGRCHAQSAQPTGVYIIGVMNDNAITIAVAGNVLVGGPYALPASASALSGITAATGSNTIANGNNPQTWNWAQTTDSQAGITFGETSAATGGTVTSGLANQTSVLIKTASGSTAAPLQIINNATKQFQVTNAGNGYFGGTLYSLGDLSVGSQANAANSSIYLNTSGTAAFAQNGIIRWADANNVIGAGTPTGLSQISAGLIGVGTGTAASVAGSMKGAAFLSASTTHALTMPVTIGSGTSIGSTILCAAADCPAGLYAVSTYIVLTTPCGTTGTYVANLIYTDDQGAKTVPVNINGTGAVPATGVLTTTSTANFGENVQVIQVASGNINYSTTAVACGTAGPMVGKLYMVADRRM